MAETKETEPQRRRKALEDLKSILEVTEGTIKPELTGLITEIYSYIVRKLLVK
jgi:hypothetical protein